MKIVGLFQTRLVFYFGAFLFTFACHNNKDDRRDASVDRAAASAGFDTATSVVFESGSVSADAGALVNIIEAGGSSGSLGTENGDGLDSAATSGESGEVDAGRRCQDDRACGAEQYCNQDYACVARQANGSRCARDRQCKAGSGCCEGTCISLSQKNHCGVSRSDEATTCGIDCDDHLFCTGDDICNAGKCIHSGNPCGTDGSCDQCDEFTDTCFVVGWSQKSPSNSPAARLGHAMTTLGSEVILIGGIVQYVPGLDGNDERYPWRWDGSNWSNQPSSGFALVRYYHAMATLNSKAVVFGGTKEAESEWTLLPIINNETWEWDDANWSQKSPSISPPARSFHAMATLGSKVVLFGGTDVVEGQPGTPLNDTWEWDGVNWTQKFPSTNPPARFLHAMATLGSKVVLFGGADVVGGQPDTPFNDTWEWDGANWTQKFLSTNPPARGGHAMAAVGSKIVLFGGAYVSGNGGIALDDTWEWDGANWTQKLPATSPSARVAHAMATLGSRVVLFGGGGVSDDEFIDIWNPLTFLQELNDTWEWADCVSTEEE